MWQQAGWLGVGRGHRSVPHCRAAASPHAHPTPAHPLRVSLQITQNKLEDFPPCSSSASRQAAGSLCACCACLCKHWRLLIGKWNFHCDLRARSRHFARVRTTDALPARAARPRHLRAQPPHLPQLLARSRHQPRCLPPRGPAPPRLLLEPLWEASQGASVSSCFFPKLFSKPGTPAWEPPRVTHQRTALCPTPQAQSCLACWLFSPSAPARAGCASRLGRPLRMTTLALESRLERWTPCLTMTLSSPWTTAWTSTSRKIPAGGPIWRLVQGRPTPLLLSVHTHRQAVATTGRQTAAPCGSCRRLWIQERCA